jgi:hypothetical protein
MHQLSEEAQAVHARHFEIENDHIGWLLAQELKGILGVTRQAYSFSTRRLKKLSAEPCPEDRGVIDDESFGHANLPCYAV